MLIKSRQDRPIFLIKSIFRRIYIYGLLLLSTIRYLVHRSPTVKSKCDVLIYLSYPGGGARYEYLRAELTHRGVDSICISDDLLSMIRKYQSLLSFRSTNFNLNIPILNYMISTYRPKVIVLEDDCFSEEAYDFLKTNNLVVINQAHAVTGRSDLFRSLHFDYYFIFGEKSLNNLNSNPYLRGGAKVVLTGSPFFQRKSAESKCNEGSSLIGLVGSYFHSSFERADFIKFQNYYSNLVRFVSQLGNCRFIYKPHLMRHPELEQQLLAMGNVIESHDNMYDFALKCRLIIMPPSFASLESAAALTPFIIYDWNPGSNMSRETQYIFGDTEYFERADYYDNLVSIFEKRILVTSDILRSLEGYYRSHVSRDDSVEFIADSICEIVNGIQ